MNFADDILHLLGGNGGGPFDFGGFNLARQGVGNAIVDDDLFIHLEDMFGAGSGGMRTYQAVPITIHDTGGEVAGSGSGGGADAATTAVVTIPPAPPQPVLATHPLLVRHADSHLITGSKRVRASEREKARERERARERARARARERESERARERERARELESEREVESERGRARASERERGKRKRERERERGGEQEREDICENMCPSVFGSVCQARLFVTNLS